MDTERKSVLGLGCQEKLFMTFVRLTVCSRGGREMELNSRHNKERGHLEAKVGGEGA